MIRASNSPSDFFLFSFTRLYVFHSFRRSAAQIEGDVSAVRSPASLHGANESASPFRYRAIVPLVGTVSHSGCYDIIFLSWKSQLRELRNSAILSFGEISLIP